jgi:parallel beta-helix repeat protein
MNKHLSKIQGREAMKRNLSLLLCLVMVLAVFALVPINVSAVNITVPLDYPTIQDAIDAANPGDTIIVKAGYYYEQLSISKELTIQGEGRDITFIDGGGVGIVVDVSAHGFNIMDISITGAGPEWSMMGLRVSNSNNCNIINCDFSNNPNRGIYSHSVLNSTFKNNIFYNNGYGLAFDDHSNDNLISGNLFFENDWGLIIRQSLRNTIENNFIISNNQQGLLLEYYSNHNEIVNNICIDNDRDGIAISDFSSNNIIVDNFCRDNRMGIRLGGSSHNIITDNNCTNNVYGIYLVTSSSNSFSRNVLWVNSRGLHLGDPHFGNSTENIFFHNNFINNVYQVEDSDPSNNSYYNPALSEGNYWSDYTGLDDGSGGRTAGDGIGDTLIPHPDTPFDLYPLMEPWREEKTPKEALKDLIQDVDDLDLPKGTENSLKSKLENAFESLEQGKDNAAKNKIGAFIREISAQSGKKLTEDDAKELMEAARNIMESI